MTVTLSRVLGFLAPGLDASFLSSHLLVHIHPLVSSLHEIHCPSPPLPAPSSDRCCILQGQGPPWSRARVPTRPVGLGAPWRALLLQQNMVLILTWALPLSLVPGGAQQEGAGRPSHLRTKDF